MTLALIANKKYKEAIKYIVRWNIVNLYKWCYLFFYNYENQTFEEATILEEAIDQEYRKSMHEGFNGFQTFVIKAQTLILSSNETSHHVELRNSQGIFSNYLDLLRKMQKSSNDLSIENQNKETIQLVKDHFIEPAI